MKTLKEALFNRKNLENNDNPYSITKEDMYGEIDGFPVGVVIRMMEEQEAQGNKPDVEVFQKDRVADCDEDGFNWEDSFDKSEFWYRILDFSYNDDNDRFEKIFFKRYPEYRSYN